MNKNWSPIPAPKLNGGLYTGQPFLENAPWGNVPVRPTTAYMTNVNLQTANPPVQALFQMAAGFRPGNNTDDLMPGIKTYTGTYNFGPFNFPCIPCFERKPQPRQNDCEQGLIVRHVRTECSGIVGKYERLELSRTSILVGRKCHCGTIRQRVAPVGTTAYSLVPYGVTRGAHSH